LHTDHVLLADIPTQARFHEANGMDMVILQGTTGEWPSLSTPERLAMAAAWRQAVPAGSRMKLILHVGHDSLVDAQRLAEYAVSLDMDAVLISAPSKFTAHSPTDQARAVVDIMAHCASIPAFYCA
jgi:N-acetylneuraminate lyase